MKTSKLSQHPEDHSISQPSVFPVKISVLGDNKRELEKELGQDYFTSAFGYLGKFNLSSPSLKMLEIYSPLKKGKYSKKSSFKLPKQGMMRSGQLFQQEMWEAVTFENVCGSLPTPSTMDHLPQRGLDSMIKQTQVHRKGRTKLANLREAVGLLERLESGQSVCQPKREAVSLLERVESSILADPEASRLAGWQLLAGGWLARVLSKL